MKYCFAKVMLGILSTTLFGLAGCGGGGGGGGGGGSSNNGTPAALSATQQNFETTLGSGYYALTWNVPTANAAPVSGTNYVYSLKDGPTSSPTQGTRTYIPTPTNLTSMLSLPSMSQVGIQRVVVNGTIYARSSLNNVNVRYSSGNIIFDFIASDGSTVMYSNVMDSCTAPIPLSSTDTIRTAPEEVDAAVGLLIRYTDSNFNLNATWRSGSAYIKRTLYLSGDTLFTYDWSGQTYGASVNGTNFTGTLEQFFANAQGGIVTIGPVQYGIGDGAIRTISGVRTWVSSAAAPTNIFPSTAYYALYEMGGSVYVGYLRMANSRNKQISSIGNTVLLDYTIRFNQAAISSIQGTLNFETSLTGLQPVSITPVSILPVSALPVYIQPVTILPVTVPPVYIGVPTLVPS